MKYYEVSWEAVEAAAKSVSLQIKSTPENPIDLVVGIARGGIIPARLVAEHLGVHDVEVIKKNDSVNDIFFKLNGYLNIVFVDDINDTGKTFKALDQLMMHISMRGQYRCVSLYKRHNTLYPQALYGIKYEEEDWLIFPWEKDTEK